MGGSVWNALWGGDGEGGDVEGGEIEDDTEAAKHVQNQGSNGRVEDGADGSCRASSLGRRSLRLTLAPPPSLLQHTPVFNAALFLPVYILLLTLGHTFTTYQHDTSEHWQTGVGEAVGVAAVRVVGASVLEVMAHPLATTISALVTALVLGLFFFQTALDVATAADATESASARVGYRSVRAGMVVYLDVINVYLAICNIFVLGRGAVMLGWWPWPNWCPLVCGLLQSENKLPAAQIYLPTNPSQGKKVSPALHIERFPLPRSQPYKQGKIEKLLTNNMGVTLIKPGGVKNSGSTSNNQSYIQRGLAVLGDGRMIRTSSTRPICNLVVPMFEVNLSATVQHEFELGVAFNRKQMNQY
ncbi:hypothetical protein M427DRAFT_496381 [Gonapodya prolifera JEL478]|uniref:Uncharacterized protein n=1 Tax=Gonapodya prolifera (strain JEL478) TaxID=1344416 RepID=A0A139AGD4_GONPJ|nr:hypothetical protein M427DRAFT_496381 [Gonapodya prolifera JEL478]|eukprot:KXS15892.1 hypothetical protein M427DRAFT_496381 [Gonapodya prolifera JEL478]